MTVADRPKDRLRIVRWLVLHPGLLEFGIVGGCLLLYFLIRGGVVNRPAAAFSHAADLIRLEQRLGLFWEPDWQRAIHASAVQVQIWNAVYFWAHAPVIAAIGFWLYFRHRERYLLIRNSFLISCLIGLFVYAVYPVTPPRLMTASGYQEYSVAGQPWNLGFIDTMEQDSPLDYQAESLKPFVNPFAALPSLHFGWAFLVGIGVLLAMRNLVAWIFAIAMPAVMFFGVVLTANHFILDAAAGLAVCLFALAASAALARWPVPWRRLLGTVGDPGMPLLQADPD